MSVICLHILCADSSSPQISAKLPQATAQTDIKILRDSARNFPSTCAEQCPKPPQLRAKLPQESIAAAAEPKLPQKLIAADAVPKFRNSEHYERDPDPEDSPFRTCNEYT